MAADKTWKKLFGIINGFFNLGPFGPMIKNINNNTVAIRDNVGTGPAKLDVDNGLMRQLDVVASDTFKSVVTQQAGAAANINVALPNNSGNSGDVLKTDGLGNWYWDTENQEGVYDYDFNFASGASIALVNMPNGFQVDNIDIEIVTPFTGGTGATVQIGVAGETDKFVAAADSALSLAAGTVFDLDINKLQAAAAQMIATFAANGATAGAGRIVVHGTVPK